LWRSQYKRAQRAFLKAATNVVRCNDCAPAVVPVPLVQYSPAVGLRLHLLLEV
jgi:hypothetical protein